MALRLRRQQTVLGSDRRSQKEEIHRTQKQIGGQTKYSLRRTTVTSNNNNSYKNPHTNKPNYCRATKRLPRGVNVWSCERCENYITERYGNLSETHRIIHRRISRLESQKSGIRIVIILWHKQLPKVKSRYRTNRHKINTKSEHKSPRLFIIVTRLFVCLFCNDKHIVR